MTCIIDLVKISEIFANIGSTCKQCVLKYVINCITVIVLHQLLDVNQVMPTLFYLDLKNII